MYVLKLIILMIVEYDLVNLSHFGSHILTNKIYIKFNYKNIYLLNVQ